MINDVQLMTNIIRRFKQNNDILVNNDGDCRKTTALNGCNAEDLTQTNGDAVNEKPK